MKSRAFFLRFVALVLLVATSCLLLTSCMTSDVLLGTGSVLTESDIEQMIDQKLSASGGTGAGDTNIININNPTNINLAAGGKALLSAVKVVCTFKVTTTVGWKPTTKEATSNGSGVIYQLDKESGDAYIITNYHVVHYEDSDTADGISEDIVLYLYGMDAEGYEIPATYVGGSQNYDIAVLKVDGSSVLKGSNAVAATFADSSEVSVLDTAIAIGNAEALGISATVGYVNVDSEYITMQNDDGTISEIRVMRIDTAVNSGNSGGGLFSDKGEVIGIVNAKLVSSYDSSIENISYAIPSNVAKYVADNIIYYCDSENGIEGAKSVYRCILGYTVGAARHYTEYDEESGKVHKRQTVSIVEIKRSGLAYGNLKVGDVIESVLIDGVTYEVSRLYHAVDCMLNARVGHTVTFNIVRDGESIAVEITITESTLVKY